MTKFSYVAGDWVATAGESADSLMPTALKYARRVGLPALTRLTFHDRARVLLRLAERLDSNRDGVYRAATKVGATRRDATADLEAAVGVLRGLGESALRDLPDATMVRDGPTTSSGPDGELSSQRLYVSPRGIGFMLNTMGYFRWGSTARVTPAFMAGVPVIVKPADAATPVATELIRLFSQSRLAPPGSLQLVNGRVETFWDYLRLGDQVCFTGSAREGLKLSKQTKVASGQVKLIVGTENVNAAVLGPDEPPGSDGFEALVACVARELTTHAGQTGTAIRRVLVPRPRLKSFAKALCRRLDETAKVGDPGDPLTTVGPLFDHSHARNLGRQVRELVTFGGRIVRGGVKPRHLSGPYYEPTVLVFDQPTPVFCGVEPFGPVVSIAGYNSVAAAVRLANEGGSSLVITMASHDHAFLREVAHGVAPYHARVRVLDPTASAGQAAGFETLAGGGRLRRPEEVAGVRAIYQWMHQVAIEGPASAVAALVAEGTLAHSK
ncbi:MAG: aldehyde dehydrogenase family protein [Bifidobacteriaceae bacterium]|jgi:oxepin-CoA hydrolase/3-oxo-5,6-dehydrosuberyl-CoA semialdehyde dehydrogenase|nr:aldehyde dehydrogenase family protein [Bifidobacteriaceae bacterium]